MAFLDEREWEDVKDVKDVAQRSLLSRVWRQIKLGRGAEYGMLGSRLGG